MKHKSLKLTAMALAMAFLMGCTQNQILGTLEASVAATEALVAALQQTGKIDPEIAREITEAISALPAAYADTVAELASTDSDATKSVKIAGYYGSTITALQLLPADAAPYANAILASIRAFLASQPVAPARAARGVSQEASAPATSTQLDARRVNAIGLRATKLSNKLAALRSGTAKTEGQR